jgi:predicted CXXCH cytochrome family protein
VDDNDNLAIDYAEGISEFHNDYLGDAQTSGCTPCHSGNSVVTLTVGGGSLDVNYGVHDVISCRTCHNINVPNTVPGENDPEGYAAVREFPADYEFAFNSGVNVTSEDLGVNKICFECHKGRTGALSADEESALVNEYMDDDVTYVGTENRSFAYLHYAPAYAILFGNESGMVPTYDDKTYAGRFEHPLPINGVAEFGCADCHNVHNTDDNNVVENKMATSIDCAGCHAANAIFAYTSLKDRTEEYSVALLDTLLEEYLAADGTEDLYPPLQEFIDVLQGDFPYTDDRTNSEGEDDPIIGEAGAVYASPEEALAVWLEGRTKVGPSLAAAKAGTIWKIFTYEDGSVEGPYDVHGHGGSWAHNSKFARQVMYDAIEDLQGDVSGLERP